MGHESGSNNDQRWKEGYQSRRLRSSIEETPVLDYIFGRMVTASQACLPNGLSPLPTQVTASPNWLSLPLGLPKLEV